MMRKRGKMPTPEQTVDLDRRIGNRPITPKEMLDIKLADLTVEEARKMTLRELAQAVGVQAMLDDMNPLLLGC